VRTEAIAAAVAFWAERLRAPEAVKKDFRRHLTSTLDLKRGEPVWLGTDSHACPDLADALRMSAGFAPSGGLDDFPQKTDLRISRARCGEGLVVNVSEGRGAQYVPIYGEHFPGLRAWAAGWGPRRTEPLGANREFMRAQGALEGDEHKWPHGFVSVLQLSRRAQVSEASAAWTLVWMVELGGGAKLLRVGWNALCGYCDKAVGMAHKTRLKALEAEPDCAACDDRAEPHEAVPVFQLPARRTS